MRGLRGWTNRIVLGAIVLGGGLLAGGFAYEQIGELRDAQRYPAPGKMVDVGGRKLHLLCKGQGTPTVVIETGMANPSFLWWPVQNDIAKVTRVCTYDRAGYGWSQSSPRELTMIDQAAELQTLLANAQIDAPFVLVGHSYGGGLVRLLAKAHPDKVSGLVLVDSTEEDFTFSPEIIETWKRQRQTTLRSALESQFGIMRFQYRHVPMEAAFASRPEFYDEWLAEEHSLIDAPVEMRTPGGFGRLGKLPLVVIRRGIKMSKSDWQGPRMTIDEV